MNRVAMKGDKRARQKFQNRETNVVSISEMEIDKIICGPNFRNHFLAISSVFTTYATFFLDESLSLVYQFYELFHFFSLRRERMTGRFV